MESLSVGWIYWIMEEDPINLFILGFTLISLAAIFRMDWGSRGYDVWEFHRRSVICPLQRVRAGIMVCTRGHGSNRYDTVDRCPILTADPGLSCDGDCLRTGKLYPLSRHADAVPSPG